MSYFFFFKQKTAYEMRISDWSSDVCSSDLLLVAMWIVTLVFGLLILRTNNAEALAQNAVSVGWIVGSAVLNTLIYTVWGTVQTSLYVELRTWKEGPSGKALEDIFA